MVANCQPVDRVKKKKTQSHACRTKRREKEKGARFSPYEARPAIKAKYIDDTTAVHASFVKRARVTGTGYVAINSRTRSRKTHQLHELVGPTSTLGLTLQKWDGMLSALLFPSYRISDQFSRTPTPIIDREGRLVAILAGRPVDDSWDALSTDAAEALEEARRRCNVPAKDGRHRRGHFLALRCGVSHGSGQTEPGNLQNNPCNAEVLAELNQKLPFMRMSGFATSKSPV